jgi:IS4 transposase
VGRKAKGTRVRVVDYTVGDGDAEPYRLFTTILDPRDVSASELALCYRQRWEIESTFDELKTHQRGPRTVLRSKSPSLVRLTEIPQGRSSKFPTP